MIVRDKMLGSVVVSLVFLSGCSAPTATLDLLTVARKGISSAADEEAHQHREIVKRLAAQMAALDSAFDADVRLVGAGQIRTGEGTPVELSPEWVISARKGYIAARDLLNEQVQSSQAAHAARRDNLKAADEALEMASELIVRQWNIAERVKQHVLNVQRRIIHD